MFAFPKCTSSSGPQRWLLSSRLGPHVYAFVPHYSASASADPHLAFKFPDQHGSHALMTQLLLQLNSLCSSYSDKTADLLPSRFSRSLCDKTLFYSDTTASAKVMHNSKTLIQQNKSPGLILCFWLRFFFKSWDSYLKISFGTKFPSHNSWIEKWI